MDTGKVAIHGKEYKTVALRINEFRERCPGFGIETELVSANDTLVVMKATIFDLERNIISTGYAEEKRNSSNINKTSALENAETSAVGRALAFFGLAGTEIASADEVANAINNQKRNNSRTPEKQSGNYHDAALAKIDGSNWAEAKKEAMKKNLSDPQFCKNVVDGVIK